MKNHGIAADKDYSYTGKNQACSYNVTIKNWEITNCVKVTPDKDLNLRGAVRAQPVVASINADKIQHYKSGVYSSSF